MKKRYLECLVLSIFLLTAAGIAWYGNCPSLPTDPVRPTVAKYAADELSYFDVTFSDIAGTYDVVNGVTYDGWCLDPWGDVALGDQYHFYCSVGSLPSGAGSIPWDKINYLLNHKTVTNFRQMLELQYVIWHLVAESTGSVPSSLNNPVWWTPEAQAIYTAVNTNGAGFVPGPGDIVAVLLVPIEGFSLADNTAQEMFIELTVPLYQNEGCTPGYWKNHTSSWPAPYTTGDNFEAIFGVSSDHESLTLLQALNLGGGGFNKIAKHGVAALLSAAHADVDYPYSVEQVIEAVKDAISGNKDAIEALAMANELGCPLGNENATASPVVRKIKAGAEKKTSKN